MIWIHVTFAVLVLLSLWSIIFRAKASKSGKKVTRVIDEKYHIEGGQIIKTSNGVPVPEDEPLVLFRARDRLALPMLVKYWELCFADECNKYQLEGVDQLIAAFQHFAENNPDVMKQPGCTRGAS